MEGRQMAKTGRGTTARRNRNTVRNSREMYVQGNAVKRLQEVPRRTDLPDVQERRRLARERKPKKFIRGVKQEHHGPRHGALALLVIVAFAGENLENIACDAIDQAVCVVDAAVPEAG